MENTTRKGIKHLYSETLKDKKFQFDKKDFINLYKNLRSSGFKIDEDDAILSVKYDGAGFRFGKDEDGKFFIESSNSGIQYSGDSFTEYSKNKNGEVSENSKCFKEMFEYLEKRNDIISILKPGSKIVCELLFTKLGKPKGGQLAFVGTFYDKKDLGSLATLAIISTMPQNDFKTIRSLVELSNDELKIIDPRIPEFNLDLMDQFLELESVIIDFKRDIVDMDSLNKRILSIQKNVNDKIYEEFKDLIIKNEGIIFKIKDSIFKVINKDFKSSKESLYNIFKESLQSLYIRKQ